MNKRISSKSSPGGASGGREEDKQKRTRIACDECHKKRTKCDGGNPCGLCIKNMTFCTTSRKVAKRGPKAGHIERLESRVRILESLLTPDQWATLERLENTKSDMNASQMDELSMAVENADNNLRLDLISLYFNHIHHKIPFLHEHSFMQNVSSHRSCLLNVMYALASIYQENGAMEDSTKAGDFYYHLASEEVAGASNDVTDYQIIGACILLFKYSKGSGRISDGTKFYSQGCNLLLKSKFHLDLLFYPDSNGVKIPETEREIRRRLFWMYYEYGLYAAFVLGKPPLLSEDIYRGALPMDDESFNLVATLERKYGTSYFSNEAKEEPRNKSYPIPFPLEDLRAADTLTGSLAHLMRILKVFEKILQLNRFNSEDDVSSESLNSKKLDFEIKQSLQNWNNSFKAWLVNHNVLILSDKSSIPTSPWMSTFLEIVYNFCIICFYRPRLLKEFEFKNGGTSTFNNTSHPIIENAANAVSNVLHKNDFAFFFINAPSFTHTIIFHLGLTYGMLLFINPDSSYSNRYNREINSCIAALSSIGRYFSPTRNKWDVLRKLANSFYRKKSEEDMKAEFSLFKESILFGYPLVDPFVSENLMEEYAKSREIMGETLA